MTVIINIGISGSGKSTWTADFLKTNLDYLRINRDDLRKSMVGDLNGYYKRPDLNQLEKIINDIQFQSFMNYKDSHKNVIIDNTHLKEKYINVWLNTFKLINDNIDVYFKLFDCDLDLAKNRVLLRDYPELTSFDTGIYHHNSQTDYIEQQYKDYQIIKQLILDKYADKII